MRSRRPPSSSELVALVQAARVHAGGRPPASRIIVPGPGQESVWDFPRPPRVESVALPVRVELGGVTIARTTRALRIVETAGAPCYYLPPDDCDLGALRRTEHWTVCEWKGAAYAYDVRAGGRTAAHGAWSYPAPLTDLGMGYERVAGWFAFYASRMDACFLGDERVRSQPGGFYGGWVTQNLTGPIKGEPGTEGW
ncbi:hypothetical protein WPS_08500 [Vulcanimicrobium alpinum]|uniref:DUF427 domain-containing protein n=1 Tax=Vulcanimicrobium alpinum TaxID=3016050 RepID=A0AAN1XV68_UNVUL|nr:hypothetical protein WPS_08500 [Vulcanimicrobium alpinum]